MSSAGFSSDQLNGKFVMRGQKSGSEKKIESLIVYTTENEVENYNPLKLSGAVY